MDTVYEVACTSTDLIYTVKLVKTEPIYNGILT